MPNLQERIEQAVGSVETDAGLLHAIVHGGGADPDVATEGGPVKPVAKAIADGVGDLQSAVAAAEGHANDAAGFAGDAAAAANAAAAAATSGLFLDVIDKTFAASPFTPAVGENGDLFRVDASGGNVVVDLNTLANYGQDVRFGFTKADSSSNTITVNAGGTDTINGLPSLTIAAQYETWTVVGNFESGTWLAHGGPSSGISGGDGIDYTGGQISVDLAADPGLEFAAGKLRVKAGGVGVAHLADAAKPYDVPFNAGFGAEFGGEDLVVQTYGELVLVRDLTIEGEGGYIDTAATGAAVIVDVLLDGASIYATRPQFAASANALTAGALSTGTADAGQRLTFKVTQIGTTVPGRKLRFTLKARLR